MKWVTRARPVIDRIACPWLIARFIDAAPEFLFAPPEEVTRRAEETGATPFDVPGVAFGHVGEKCSFDAFVGAYGLQSDPAVATLAEIVRGADTGRPDLTPQSAGLLAISKGLREVTPDDHDLLRRGFVIYDALYAWAGGAGAKWPATA
ncbi:chromate resistance protein ChrB domain-containing protein [Xanthobacter oligotrophicus]|uniref:chromate resistance protein ChrB domain-containing protein n=1 Tax=Xanthobacter oligotrophicus TaxID=2607286 RepID=UPI0011F2D702|nr:chromate resistance protein ChrB domain-containing protein [Xanthobacter oligotrophicus]MCG5238073.1 chromate resistance protein [Xanthobacter oligotrophicus]